MTDRRSARVAALAAALALAAACHRAPRPSAAPGTSVRPGFVQTGIASWYGADFHGRPTSSREIYDMYDMTAAHPTLPLGTWVQVTSLENGRIAVVRINDRGPFAKGRIIDLSYAAARTIGLVGPGTGRVRLETLPGSPAPPDGAAFVVQAGAFASRGNAEGLRSRLSSRYRGVYISRVATEATVYYRVRMDFPDRAAADRTARRLAAEGTPALILER